ncbi:MAG: hypothetical protein ACLFRV_03965 [Acidimicrobiales bacterium]
MAREPGDPRPNPYLDKLRSVAIAPSATPTRGDGKAAEVNAREARWHRDMPAYKRLRRDGLQPPQIDGSARLEQELT